MQHWSFGELPKHGIWAVEVRARICTVHVIQSRLKMSSWLWKMLSSLCFTQADFYIHVLSSWRRYWGWFPRLNNHNTLTWTHLHCRMRSCHCWLTFNWVACPCWTVLELTHRGKVSKHEEMCYLVDCIFRLDLFMRFKLFPNEGCYIQISFHHNWWSFGGLETSNHAATVWIM